MTPQRLSRAVRSRLVRSMRCDAAAFAAVIILRRILIITIIDLERRPAPPPGSHARYPHRGNHVQVRGCRAGERSFVVHGCIVLSVRQSFNSAIRLYLVSSHQLPFRVRSIVPPNWYRLHRPPFVDPTTNICYDTDNSDCEGWLTKQSMWLKVRQYLSYVVSSRATSNTHRSHRAFYILH